MDKTNRAWVWDDLWRFVRNGFGAKAPKILSPAAASAALDIAIDRELRAGRLTFVSRVIDLPGFRRRLARRVERWTRSEADPIELFRSSNAETVELGSIYAAYREILVELAAVDDAGLEAWASRAIANSADSSINEIGSLNIIEPAFLNKSRTRAIASLANRSISIHVVLSYNPEPALAEAFAPAIRMRETLTRAGFGTIDHRSDSANRSSARSDRPADSESHAEIDRPADSDRPAGLRAIETETFRSDARNRPKSVRTDGVTIAGAPRGEGQALVAARRTRDLIDQGVDPKDILIVFRRWDDQARILVETLRSWEIATCGGERRSAATDPAFSALRAAIELPLDDWEADGLIRLLRHGRFRPSAAWNDSPLSLALAAAAIRDSGAFRGINIIKHHVNDVIIESENFSDKHRSRGRSRRIAAARKAIDVLNYLESMIEPLVEPRTWRERVERLRNLADEFGLDAEPEVGERARENKSTKVASESRVRGSQPIRRTALEHLFQGLEDEADVLDELDQGELLWPWEAFVLRVVASARELEFADPDDFSEGVAVATIDEASGACVDHLLIVDLAEGTFPDRSAVEAMLASVIDAPLEDDDADDSDSLDRSTDPEGDDWNSAIANDSYELYDNIRDRADDGDYDSARSRMRNEPYARETYRFSRLIGSANRSATFVYPTTDESGRAMLTAGFLDDVRRTFADSAEPRFAAPVVRLNAIPPVELAAAPAELRVLAIARAAIDGDASILNQLVKIPEHRDVLTGSAFAFLVGHARDRRGGKFGRYDGVIRDRRAIARIRARYDSNASFSAGRLETYALCPFLTFLKEALGIEEAVDRGELEIDARRRGGSLHRFLEIVHHKLIDLHVSDKATLAERIELTIEPAIDQLRDESPPPDGPIAAEIASIDEDRTRNFGVAYRGQCLDYAKKSTDAALPRELEWDFGGDDDDTHPPLILGSGERSARIRGRIDRIDVEETEDTIRYRVIDYKTRKGKNRYELLEGLAIQPPLYAMAYENFIKQQHDRDGIEPTPIDFGYWILEKQGYGKLVKFTDDGRGGRRDRPLDWPRYRAAFEEYVLDLVESLRNGRFPVKSKDEDCTSYCAFCLTCRIAQARRSGKIWDDAPRLNI